MAIKYPKGTSLGSTDVKNFPRVQYDKIVEIIDVVNGITDGTGDVTVDDATVTGDLTVTGTTTLNGTLVLGDAAADALTVNATATYGEPINYDNATTITAFATGGQASATALTAEINNVTTVATAGDSVKLPAAVAGKHIHVKNSGATALDIFPATSDSIDALAVNLAIRIQPGSSVDFYAKDAIVWESSIDETFTLMAPTTNTGALVLKAVASAGNFNTQIQNASQAAARIYTIPDAGANASFVQTEGAQTINGVKTFGGQIVSSAGLVTAPGVVVGVTDNGFYEVSGTQLGASISNVLVGGFNTTGLFTDIISEQTTATGVTIDSVKLKDGGVSNAGDTMIAGFFPTVAAQSLSGAGAVNVTSYLTKITSTGVGDALTIASGTQIGQRKRVQHVVDGGSSVLTGVFVGGTTITFTAVAEFADLLWTGASWAVLELGNSAAPGTPPVLA